MESFDFSLKYLLAQEPADFIRFGLGCGDVTVLRPVESVLPSRGRDVDGGYLIKVDGTPQVAHLEFHRRHQGAEDLAIDVAEAQVRLYRRERVPVLSQVWDLYGKSGEPVLADRILHLGQCSADCQSQSAYRRVNLRGYTSSELLQHGPPALWPLLPLTRDGKTEEAVRRARDAIEERSLNRAQRADHLAVLWFVAEAEDFPVRLLQELLTEDKLMESQLYQSIFAKGEARGEALGEARGEARGAARGEANAKADTINQVLIARLGYVDAAIRQKVRSQTDAEILSEWHHEAILSTDAEAARRLIEKIQRVPAPPSSTT